jgi:hypothetical protein
LTPSSLSTASIHINFVVALANDLYLAYVLKRETVGCFFALQEIRFGPTKITKPHIERLSSNSAQFASEKALNKVEEDFCKVVPT